MYEALCSALAQAQGDTAVRAVLVSGEGAGFSAGNDLNDFLGGLKFDGDNPIIRLLRAPRTPSRNISSLPQGKSPEPGTPQAVELRLLCCALPERVCSYTCPSPSL